MHWNERNLFEYHTGHRTRVWRVVETQEIAATKAITASAADQSRLESILDASKPTVPDDCSGLSYLLFTPFRYPPLDYGSRFGSALERGIFYASTDPECAFAETAVYLWLFQAGPLEVGPLETIRDHRTLFSIVVTSTRVINLTNSEYTCWKDILCDPADWSASQQFGSQAREVDTDYILYTSARMAKGINTAVFNPSVFADSGPQDQQHWQLVLNDNTCWFGKRGESIEFFREDFEKCGRIPHPCL